MCAWRHEAWYSVVMCSGVRSRYCLKFGRCDVQTLVRLCFSVQCLGELEHCGKQVSSHVVLPLWQDRCFVAMDGGVCLREVMPEQDVCESFEVSNFMNQKNRFSEPKKQKVGASQLALNVPAKQVAGQTDQRVSGRRLLVCVCVWYWRG